jgi:hypothetical protein
VRKDRRVPLARTELTAHKAPPVLKVLLVTTAPLDRRVLLDPSDLRVPLVTMARPVRKARRVRPARTEPTARLVRKDRRALLARTELTAHKAPPVPRVLLVTTARPDLRVLLARSDLRVLSERLVM